MSPASLIRHHAGRMAGPARWYLAALGMVSLLLLAAHFAVQEHVQKTLRQAVHDWMQTQGGSVQHVRYRLLRGALTLQGVGWSDGAGMRIAAENVYMRTSSRAMLSASPVFSLIRIERPVLNLPAADLSGWLTGEASGRLDGLTGLLAHAERVSLEDMTLKISPAASGEGGGALLTHAGGRIGHSQLRLDGLLGEGRMMLDARIGQAGGLSGRVRLADASVESLALLSGTAAFEPGLRASGDLIVRGDWGKRDVGIEGRLQLGGLAGKATLGVQGGWSASGADVDLACDKLQLTTLPLAWPELAGRTLTSARFSGVMRLQRRWQGGDEADGAQGWSIGLDGGMQDVQLASEALPAWDIGRLEIRRGLLLAASGALNAAELRMEDAELRLSVGDVRASDATPVSPRIAKLELTRLRPHLFFDDASSIMLPAMSGKGRLQPDDGGGSIQLASSGSEAETPAEAWKVEARGDPFGAWQASVSASRVPLVRLRPLLPSITLPGEQGAPEYGGLVDISLQMRPAAPGVALSGRAVLSDASMTQGGDRFEAARIEADIEAAGSDGVRRLSRVGIDQWRYQLALRPLPRITQSAIQVERAAESAPEGEPGASAAGDVVGVIEWTAPMRVADWQVGELVAEHGSISLGQPDALIGEEFSLHVRGLRSGELAPFTLVGLLGEGELKAGGKLHWQPTFAIEGKATLSHALPFMFNDWMRLSGMPRFVRGRLDAKLDIQRRGPVLTGGFAGRLDVRAHQAVLETGVYPEDPMLPRTGFTSQGLLERLNNPRGFHLSIPFEGAWLADGAPDSFGEAALVGLKQAAASSQVSLAPAEPAAVRLVRLRLQGTRGFSHNERVRLRKMARTLLADSRLVVELTPQLGTAQADSAMVERVRDSQRQVERYLNGLGVGSRRIFPVWPQSVHRHGDAPGLLLEARAP